MGIGDWLFGSKQEVPETTVRRAPTAADLLESVERVEQTARDGKVPALVLSRLLRVTGIVRETIPRLDRVGISSLQGYSVMATATDYLPEALGGYLRLPRHWADTRPVDRGKTPLMILVDQLDLLAATMDKVFDAINRADAEALVVHGRFLQEKFGHASTGGNLALGADAPLPPMPPGPGSPTGMPSPAPPASSPASSGMPSGAPPTSPPAGSGMPSGSPLPAEPDIRLQPPIGR